MKYELKDRSIFVVGLLASFLAFGSYKEELSRVYVTVNHNNFSLDALFLIFVTFLTISVYFYALDYLKYSFPFFQNSIIFKIFAFLGSWFYSIALFFPILILFVTTGEWFVSTPLGQMTRKYEFFVFIFDLVGVAIIAVPTILNSIYQIRSAKIEAIDALDKTRRSALQKAIELFNFEFYSETVIESFKVLELYLREHLLEDKNLFTKNLTPTEVIRLAAERNLLNPKYIDLIKQLQMSRNIAVHTGETITSEQARNAIEIVKSVINGGMVSGKNVNSIKI